MKLQHIITIILFFLLNFSVHAQKNCLNTLREAKQFYEQGLIEEIPELLSDCMEEGFTRTQRIEAYKLLILAYLFDDDQFAAERTMDEFLRKFPEYEVMPNDPVEFVYLLESYKTSSYYSINLTFGPTFSNRHILEPYSTQNVHQTEYFDRTGTGFQVGLGVSRNLWKSVNGNIGVFYVVNNYSYSEESTTPLAREQTFARLEVSEQLRIVNLPVSLTYSFGRGNLNYVMRLGGSAGFVTEARISPSRMHPATETISGSRESIVEKRKELYYAVVTGAGLEYKIPRGFLVLDMRYHVGIENMTTGDRYSSPRMFSRYLHLDDDFRLNFMSISFGYHFSIYQSRRNQF